MGHQQRGTKLSVPLPFLSCPNVVLHVWHACATYWKALPAQRYFWRELIWPCQNRSRAIREVAWNSGGRGFDQARQLPKEPPSPCLWPWAQSAPRMMEGPWPMKAMEALEDPNKCHSCFIPSCLALGVASLASPESGSSAWLPVR